MPVCERCGSSVVYAETDPSATACMCCGHRRYEEHVLTVSEAACELESARAIHRSHFRNWQWGAVPTVSQEQAVASQEQQLEMALGA